MIVLIYKKSFNFINLSHTVMSKKKMHRNLFEFIIAFLNAVELKDFASNKWKLSNYSL